MMFVRSAHRARLRPVRRGLSARRPCEGGRARWSLVVAHSGGDRLGRGARRLGIVHPCERDDHPRRLARLRRVDARRSALFDAGRLHGLAVPTAAEPGEGRSHAGHAVGMLDASRVAHLTRITGEGPIAEGEVRMRLNRNGRAWSLVTNAWFFKEGEATKWSNAKFGEFRLLPNGRALLIGLANAELQPIK